MKYTEDSPYVEHGFWRKYASERRRKAVRITCPQCLDKREIVKKCIKSSIKKNGSYSLICRKCHSENRSFCFNCAYCGKEGRRKKARLVGSKSGLHFCDRKCKEAAQADFSNPDFDCIRPSGYVNGLSNYRERAKEYYGCKCMECEISSCEVLQVHHIDGDSTNNTLENLEVLCPNHHMLRHMKFENGVWVVNFRVLTPRDKLPEVRKLLE